MIATASPVFTPAGRGTSRLIAARRGSENDRGWDLWVLHAP